MDKRIQLIPWQYLLATANAVSITIGAANSVTQGAKTVTLRELAVSNANATTGINFTLTRTANGSNTAIPEYNSVEVGPAGSTGEPYVTGRALVLLPGDVITYSANVANQGGIQASAIMET